MNKKRKSRSQKMVLIECKKDNYKLKNLRKLILVEYFKKDSLSLAKIKEKNGSKQSNRVE